MTTFFNTLRAGFIGVLFLSNPQRVTLLKENNPLAPFSLPSQEQNIAYYLSFADEAQDYTFDYSSSEDFTNPLLNAINKIRWYIEIHFNSKTKEELLFDAIEQDNLPKTKFLIENGADVNAKNKNYFTLLHLVKSAKIVKILINNGANVNEETTKGTTPLHYARSPEIAKILIDNGADVNAKDVMYYTPLHWTKSVEVAQILLDYGADLNAKNRDGSTPLHVAKSVEVAQILLDYGADVNAKSYARNTPLHLARTAEIAQFLLDNGASADINAQNTFGETPLHLAIKSKNKKLIVLLLKHGADVNIMNEFNQNSLHLARARNLLDLFQKNEITLFSEEKKQKNAFVFFPVADWNGAFTFKDSLLLSTNLMFYYSVAERIISNYRQLIECLDQVPLRSLHLVVISGHGSPEGIIFGKKEEEKSVLDKKALSESSQLKEVFSRSLAPNATVVLNSCLTAKNENSIAYELLRNLPLGTKIIAAKKKISYYVKVHSWIPFDLSFYGGKHYNDITVRKQR